MIVKKTKLHIKLGSRIRVYGFPHCFNELIQRNTRHKNPDYQKALQYSKWGAPSGILEYINMADLSEDECISFPRGVNLFDVYPKAYHPLLRKASVEDNRNEAETEFPERLIEFRAEQLELIEEFKNAELYGLRPYGAHLYIAPTATGKTIGALGIAEQTGQNTLIITPTNLIRDGWYEDLKLMYGFSRDEVGLIQGTSFKLHHQITLASMNTLVKREVLFDYINSTFGTVILDEAHKIPANQIWKYCQNCRAKYLIGLTAEDSRPDGKQFYVEGGLGKPVHVVEEKENSKNVVPISKCFFIPSNWSYKPTLAEENEETEYSIDSSDVTDQIMLHPEINLKVVERIKRDWDNGHSVIAVTPRTMHLDILYDLCHEAGIEDANILSGETNKHRVYTTMLLSMIRNKECRCVLASQKAVQIGANLPPLDRLHLVIPPANETDLNQICGRVRRVSPGKKNAMLHYYHYGALSRRWSQMASFYMLDNQIKVKSVFEKQT